MIQRTGPVRSLTLGALLTVAELCSCSIYESSLIATGGTEAGAVAGTNVLPPLGGSAAEAAGATSGASSGVGAMGGASAGVGAMGGASPDVGAMGGASAGVGGSPGAAGDGGASLGGGGAAGSGSTTPPCVAENVVGVALQAPQIFEAEDAILTGGATPAKGTSETSGTGFVDFIGREGSLTWLVEVSIERDYELRWTYAAMDQRDMALDVGCIPTEQAMPFNTTGSWFSGWKSDISRIVHLKKGTVRIVLSTNGGSGPNIDKMNIAAK